MLYFNQVDLHGGWILDKLLRKTAPTPSETYPLQHTKNPDELERIDSKPLQDMCRLRLFQDIMDGSSFRINQTSQTSIFQFIKNEFSPSLHLSALTLRKSAIGPA